VEWQETRVAARALGLRLQSLEVRTPGDFDRAFARAREDRADALIAFSDALINRHRKRIVDFTAVSRLPSMYTYKEFVDVGGFIAYGPNITDLYRRAAVYVDRLLKGAKAADLPIEQPTRFELAINMTTAKTLGLTIPSSLLLRADHVVK